MLNNPESNQWKAYSMSKFATALLASNLNKLEGVEAVAVHPGAVKTEMTDKINSKLRIKLNFIQKHLLSAVNNNLIIIRIKIQEIAGKHVVYCVENEIKPDKYRNVDKTCKLNKKVLKESNLYALEKLTKQLLQNYL